LTLLADVPASDHLNGIPLLDALHNTILLQRLWGERHDLDVAFVAQFTCDRPEDAGTPRVLHIVRQNDGGVVIELDVRAVFATIFLGDADDNRLHHRRLLDARLRSGGLDGSHDDITY